MFAVAVESCPLDGRGALSAPVEGDLFAVMADNQISAFELTRQADDEQANLARRTGSINMLAENARRPRVNLQRSAQFI